MLLQRMRMRLLLGLMDSQDRLGWILEIIQRLHCSEVQSVPIFVISKPDQVTFMFKQILGFVDLHTSPLDLQEDCGVAINYPVLQQEVFSILPASGYLQNSQIKSKKPWHACGEDSRSGQGAHDQIDDIPDDAKPAALGMHAVLRIEQQSKTGWTAGLEKLHGFRMWVHDLQVHYMLTYNS